MSGTLSTQPIPIEDESSSIVFVDQRPAVVEVAESLERVIPPRAHEDEAHEGDEEEEEEEGSYQEHPRYRTWKKHTTHLYQLSMHIDLVWESPSVALMPYMSVKDRLATQTILCGTRTGGQEQNYLQFLHVTTPIDASRLDDEGTGFNDGTGEVGGFGSAPAGCGMQIERRMYHDGDVLATRYMHANPLLLGTASSDNNLYVFDWSRVPKTLKPNNPERPRGPLPPNSLSLHAGDEERHAFMKRMRQIDDVAAQQQSWDSVRGAGQHVVALRGHSVASSHLDWNTTSDGSVASGAGDTIHVWQVGNLSKSADRTVDPYWTATLDDETAVITDTKFSWTDPQTFLATTSTGSLLHADVRRAGSEINELCTIAPDLCAYSGITSLAVSALNGNLIALGTASGTMAVFDMRNADAPVLSEPLHKGEVTCVQWCPHQANLIATGGDDGIVVLRNVATGEVAFKHSAHTHAVTDMQWCWQDAFRYEMVSVDCNAITLWRPRNAFLA
jgi:hypothetical protein